MPLNEPPNNMKEKLQKYIGKIETINLDGLMVKVMIKDVKNSYGKDRYLITPVEGSGEKWTEKIS